MPSQQIHQGEISASLNSRSTLTTLYLMNKQYMIAKYFQHYTANWLLSRYEYSS